MPILAVECRHCGAKLKVKSGLARTPAEIKCPKCTKMIPVTKDAAAQPATPAAAPAPETAAASDPVPATPAAVPAPAEPPAPPPPEPTPEPPVAEAEPPAVIAPETVAVPPPLPVTPPARPEPEAVREEPPPPPPPPPAPVQDPVPVTAAPAADPAPDAAQTTSSVPRKPAAPIVLSHLGEQHGAHVVSVRCPACHWQTRVREELIGKKIRCKQCGGIVPVVAEAGGPQAAPVAVPAAVPQPPAVVLAPVVEPAPAVTPVEPEVPASTTAVPAPAPAAPQAPQKPLVQTAAMDALVREIAHCKTQLIQIQEHKADAERRAVAAEKAFQELAGQRALDEVNTRRRMAELEAQVSALRAALADLKADTLSELQAASQRVALLQQRLSRMT